ncbi:MAG: DUF1501 domain-containing protein [Chitinophagales bacterium]|nr:DUF1501 domain-containing protein [Bacteroidota bacterium]MCB9042642.1 DUF1501 domain-containing protein [Chitinophagales bacterium]
MCKQHSNKNRPQRKGITNTHTTQHQRDHLLWSRRNFLQVSGVLGMGAALLNNIPVSALPFPSLKSNNENNGRVLVLVRLEGGNDGLNMIIPRFNDYYYSLRPNIGITEANLSPLYVNGVAQDFGLNNNIADLMPLWNEGKMAIIHNVGYEIPNLSHFRSSDIWSTASNPEELWTTGWIGRYTDYLLPAFVEAPPTTPPALQIGNYSDLVFKGPAEQMALVLNNPTEFYQIAQTGQLYSTEGLGTCARDTSLAFLRQAANNSFRYSESLKEAFNASNTIGNYPANDSLAEQLRIVARLIKGNLGTQVYIVSIGGFDTHDNQPTYHPQLLNSIGKSIKAFYDDLQENGYYKNVLTATFSEFGRTIDENGSLGTDHGNGAPMMLFGENVNGFFGTPPDLSNYDPYYRFFDGSTDFRNVYASILQDWFCAEPEISNFILGRTFDTIPNLLPACATPVSLAEPSVLLGHNPNKTQNGMIDIKYSIMRSAYVRLLILNPSGNILRTLISEYQDRGSYTFSFSPAQLALSPGKYVYRLDTNGKVYSRAFTI